MNNGLYSENKQHEEVESTVSVQLVLYYKKKTDATNLCNLKYGLVGEREGNRAPSVRKRELSVFPKSISFFIVPLEVKGPTCH